MFALLYETEGWYVIQIVCCCLIKATREDIQRTNTPLHSGSGSYGIGDFKFGDTVLTVKKLTSLVRYPDELLPLLKG